MLKRLLRLLARWVERRPRLLVLLLLIPALVLAMLAFEAPVDLTFVGMMDRSQTEVNRYLEQSERLGFGGTLIVLLRVSDGADSGNPSELLDRGVEALQASLTQHEEIAGVVPPIARDWVLRQVLWLMPQADFDRTVATLQETLGTTGPAEGSGPGVERFEEARALLQILDQELEVTSPNERVVQIRLLRDPLTRSFGDDPYLELVGLVDAALQGTGLDYEMSGLPAVASQDQQRTLRTIRRLSPLSLCAVLLLVVVVERRPRVLLAVLAALLLAVGATIGLIGILAGGITLMETFFGVTVFGLGIDFAIHLLMRLNEEKARGANRHEALALALGGTGRGIVAGAVTTAGAFLVVATAPDPVAVHLGLSGGMGLLFCLLFMLVLVPVAWRSSEVPGVRRRSKTRVATRDGAISGLAARLTFGLAQDARRRPILHLSMAALILAAALLGSPRFALESRVERVFNRDVPAVASVNDIRERFGVSGAPWILEAKSLPEAALLAEQLRANEAVFATVSSPSDVLPVDREEMERREAVLADLLPQLQQALGPLTLAATLQGPGSDVASMLEVGRAFVAGIQQGPPTEADLPMGLRLQFRGVRAANPESEVLSSRSPLPWLVYAYGRGSTFDARVSKEARLAAQQVSPEATGLSALLEAVLLGPRPWVPTLGAAVILFVIFVLAIDLRSWRWVLLAMVPVVVASGVTFGLLCWLPTNFNIMTVLVVPLLFGLGVDDGIHVVHRMREGRESLERATGSVGRAILMTTATTCASFAILLFTNHPGLESMALVMLIGLPLCLLASVSTLPALAGLLIKREDRMVASKLSEGPTD